MNPNRQYLSFKKLTGRDIVRIAARHNLREIQVEIGAREHIDPARIRLNRVSAGAATAAEVAADAERLLRDAGVSKLRKDAVRAVEIVASLPAGACVDLDAYFSDTLAWVRNSFGVPVLSAVVHLDEAAPHCHILVLPLIAGHMVGSDLVGNRTRLRGLQTAFFEQVARTHGLARPASRPRLSSATRQKAASLALTAIQGNPVLLGEPGVERALLDLIKHDPEPLLASLKLKVPTPAKPATSFVEIMTKPCKAEKPIGFKATPIGFHRDAPETERTLSCVGFNLASVPVSSANVPTFTRCADDAPAEYWDSERGEFRLPATRASGVRDEAVRELERSLERLRPRPLRRG